MNELAVSLSLILLHLTPATFLFLAVMVARSSQKASYARWWIAFCCLTAIAWTCAIFTTFYLRDLAVANQVSRLAISFGALSGLTYYFFQYEYLQLSRTHRIRILLVELYAGLLLLGFLLTSWLHQGVQATPQGLLQPKPGPLMPLYLLFVLYVFGNAVYQSRRAYLRSTGQRRLQLRFFFIGSIIAMLSAIGSLLPFSSSTSFWVWIPSALTLSFPALLTYVVVRHHLWDIRTVFHKTMLWMLVSVLCVVPATLLLSRFLRTLQSNLTLLLLLTLLLYLMLLFLVRKVQPWVDGLFDRRRFSQRQVVDAFIKDIRHLQHIHQLAHSLNDTLRRKLHVSHSRIMLANADGVQLHDAMGSQSSLDSLSFLPQDQESAVRPAAPALSEPESEPEPASKPPALELDATRSDNGQTSVSHSPPWLYQWLVQQDRPIDAVLVEASDLSASRKQELLALFAARAVSVMLPLLHNDKLIGLIELGEKSNLGSYSRGDFQLLERIRSATEVAVHNARLYQDLQATTENLRTLTATLEDRVQQRTAALEHLNHNLEQAYEQLQEAINVQARFFTNITHELRTPLTLILAPLEDYLMQQEQLPPEWRPSLRIMHRQAVRLYNLINDLLDFAQIDAHKLRLEISEFSLDEHLRSIVASFEALARRKHVRLNLVLPSHPVRLYGDTEKLDRVFINLLGNALKFTPEHGHVTVRLYEARDAVVCEVEDSGIGISPQQQERIFDRFAQVYEGHDRAYEGTGLGLALVQELIHYHQGTIEVQSDPDRGALFRVHLRKGDQHFPSDALERRKEQIPTSHTRRASDRDPLSDFALSARATATRATVTPSTPRPGILPSHSDVPALHEPEEATTASPPPPDLPPPGIPTPIPTSDRHDIAADDLPSKVIMVVEDNPDMQRYLRSILEPHFHLMVADNGREALQLLQSQHPTLVVSDVMMPRMSGHELCRRLKASPETMNIPVILLTAQKGADRAVEGFQVGADDYLTKPFNSQELLARIRVQLKLRAMGQQLALQEKVSLMGLLSAGLAHEVKNPANALLHTVAPLRALTADIDGDDREAITELLDITWESAQRITQLCNDLLGLASTDTESVAPWHVDKALEQSLRILKPECPAGIRIVNALEHTSLPVVYRSQFNQILLNLLSNALRAVGEEGEITVETRSDPNTFTLLVRDTGVGIPPSDISRVFDPLFTTAEVGKGTGIGLYLVQRIVKSHGGRILLQSSVGQGTEFTIECPLQPAPEQSLPTSLSQALSHEFTAQP